MSTIKSSAENLTLNADGANNDIIFQSNGSNVATLDQAGLLTATTFAGSGASLTALNATNLASGTVPTARLGTGTANSTVHLRGDGTWAAAGSTSATDLTSGTLPTGRLPTGSILQVVRMDTETEVTCTNSAYVDIFGSDLSITAKETGSKFHFLVNLGGLSNQSTTAAYNFRVAGSETLHLNTHFAYGFSPDNHRITASWNAPMSGTATQDTTYSYNVEMKNSNSSFTIKAQNNGGHSSLVIMEVAG